MRTAASAVIITTALLLAVSGPATAHATEEPTPTPTAKKAAPTTTPAPNSLAAAARQIRLRRGTPIAGRTPLVITNKNLQGYAEKGSLTYSTGSGSATASSGPDGAEGKASDKEKRSDEEKRAYWRGKYQDQKNKIANMQKRIQELDKEIPGLWTQFYSWDDPAYRDGVIKPKLDRALQERKELGDKLPAEQNKLEEILDQARRDGALPGWFRGLVD
jgi:hypothetical protein